MVSTFGRALDTSEAASAKQVELWRSMTHGEKAELVAGLYRATIQILDAGIAARYPHASPRERFLRRAIVTLGRELTVAAYPEASAITD